MPDNPAGWLQTVARRRVVDRLRSEAMAHRRHALVATDLDRRPPSARADPGGLVEDDLLRLVLMCTHPALAPEAASALALRLVLGVSTHDIARLFLVPEPTMTARLTRAKKTIVAWHREEIDEALGLLTSPALVDAELPDGAATYLLRALVGAEHATAPSAAATRWDRVTRHYDQLVRLDPGSAARARAVRPRSGIRSRAGSPRRGRPTGSRGRRRARRGRRGRPR